MAGPVFVKATNTATAGSPSTNTFTGGNVTNNLIILFIGIRALLGASPVTSVTDTEGNTYTSKFTGSFRDANNNMWHEVWLAPVTNGSGTNNVVTVTWTGGTNCETMAVEYNTGASANPFDTAVGAPNSGTGPTATTINCAGSSETIVCMGTFQGGGTSWASNTLTFRTSATNQVCVIGDKAGSPGSNNIDVSGFQPGTSTPSPPSLIGVALIGSVGFGNLADLFQYGWGMG